MGGKDRGETGREGGEDTEAEIGDGPVSQTDFRSAGAPHAFSWFQDVALDPYRTDSWFILGGERRPQKPNLYVHLEIKLGQ